MIVEEYTMALVAKWHLLDMEQKTTVDKKLEIEYIRDDSHSFKRFLFNHAFYEGLKVTEWIGSDCYELSLQSISNPTSNKSHQNEGSLSPTRPSCLGDLQRQAHLQMG